MTIPNIITISRIILVPFIAVALLINTHFSVWMACGLFIIGSFTDFLDGYIARKLNQTSEFGAFLDPIADKLLVGSVLVIICAKYNTLWLTIPTCVIIMRELFISALREWGAKVNLEKSIKVSMTGKIKTAVQMISIGFLIAGYILESLHWVGVAALVGAAFLTIYSMIEYMVAFYGAMKQRIKNTKSDTPLRTRLGAKYGV
ncbi:hypothetical protein A3715_17635 [Oleiphilus sp. HI0009]|nr:hypothetical protein A3715_17635 [Oleiphilus sp. HI0009]